MNHDDACRMAQAKTYSPHFLSLLWFPLSDGRGGPTMDNG